ncbi:MAG: hypothetical protein IPN14_00190 [Bacteroidetes bacterium]|nr:hypothetical protein [Bacteroidota bacterium]
MADLNFKQLMDELSLYSLCTYFVLPLVGVNKNGFGAEVNFLNSFLSRDGSLIYVEVYMREFLGMGLPEHRVCKDDNGKDYLEFKIPQKFKGDVALFMAGKYSEMSETVKRIIRENSTLQYKNLKDTTYRTDVRLLALEKSQVLRDYWNSQLWDLPSQSHIDEDMELLSKPNDSIFLDKELFLSKDLISLLLNNLNARTCRGVFGKGCVLPERKY